MRSSSAESSVPRRAGVTSSCALTAAAISAVPDVLAPRKRDACCGFGGRWLLVPTEMLTQEEHPPGKPPSLPTAPRKEDKVGAAAGSSTGAQPLPHRVHWPHGLVLWLLVGLVVAAAVAVTVDRTGFSGGTHTRTTSSLAPDPALADDAAATVIATYRERIPELMAEEGIPGLAVALVNKDRTLWVEGFGHIDEGGSAPVNADTIFSVQSMSKLFTATAVMQAVATGRLDLDAPITAYLPEFTVHSAFEEHPERKITLRMLLSHTAGFTHEAPIGNNNELDPGDFDDHVRSISHTWLRFPVGTGYAYSNLVKGVKTEFIQAAAL